MESEMGSKYYITKRPHPYFNFGLMTRNQYGEFGFELIGYIHIDSVQRRIEFKDDISFPPEDLIEIAGLICCITL